MYRHLFVICAIGLLSGCYVVKLPDMGVPQEHVDVFNETIIRMRDDRDTTVLDLDEGRRIGERAFYYFKYSALTHYFELTRGNCYQPDSAEHKLICVMKKNLSYNSLGLNATEKHRCASRVTLVYEFGYQSPITDNSVWSSLAFNAQQEGCGKEVGS
jgi:hypothetical protein